jgi:hypothetical protein
MLIIPINRCNEAVPEVAPATIQHACSLWIRGIRGKAYPRRNRIKFLQRHKSEGSRHRGKPAPESEGLIGGRCKRHPAVDLGQKANIILE